MAERLIRKTEFQKQPLQSGIQVICGPMFSSKSHELIRIVSGLPFAGRKVLAFKPDVDNRRGLDSINSESGLKFPAISVSSSIEILKRVNSEIEVIAIDEAQFFDMDLPDVCDQLAQSGKQVIVAGLDKDFRGETFGPMGQLLNMAEDVDKRHALCACCGRNASYTQRIIVADGEKRPANYTDPVVLVGATNLYEARCRDCHEVPGKPRVSFEESELKREMRFLISGVGPEEDEIVRFLEETGYSVYRPPSNEGKDIFLQSDEDREERIKCDAAIFGPGMGVGISEARDWAKQGKPSMLFVRGEIDHWDSPSRSLYTVVHGYTEASKLPDQLGNFAREVRSHIRRSHKK